MLAFIHSKYTHSHNPLWRKADNCYLHACILPLTRLLVLLYTQERECEHLRQIIKELSQSRSKAHKTKVELEEQFAGLQKEYYRYDGHVLCNNF